MRVALVGNYAPDAQQSMLRFGGLLGSGMAARGWEVVELRPRERCRKLRRRAGGATAKWLGYVDKYLLFQPALRRMTAAADLVHIVDHSNAVYVPAQPRQPWVVTCHDLLAVRGALGEDTDCPASWLGRRLQRRILRGLGRARAVACDSTSTFSDLERLLPPARGQVRQVILLGQNRAWQRIGPAEARRRLAAIAAVPWDRPFLLHVGSGLRRKNRDAVVRVLGRLRERWPGNVVFCGSELSADLAAIARGCGVSGRVFAVPAPTDAELEAAYALAHALLYPSRCEGFGWPVIEAQACGCPAICSDRTSLPEVAGGAGLVCALEDEAAMARAVERLADPGFRAGVVQRGLANVGRFTPERMLDEYGELYARVRSQPEGGR